MSVLNLSRAQRYLMRCTLGLNIRRRERDGTFMPFATESRTCASLVSKGLVRWVACTDPGYTHNGIVPTDIGLSLKGALQGTDD